MRPCSVKRLVCEDMEGVWSGQALCKHCERRRAEGVVLVRRRVEQRGEKRSREGKNGKETRREEKRRDEIRK